MRRHHIAAAAMYPWQGCYQIAWVALILVQLLSAPEALAADPIPAHMRALHMGGNWGNNAKQIKLAGPGPLATAPSIAGAQIIVNISRGSYVDSDGVTITNDVATVELDSVVLGDGQSFGKAGFWVVRNVNSGDVWVQFRPSLDPTLTNVSGFAGDVSFSMPKGSTTVDIGDLATTSGPARAFVLAILAHGAALVGAPTAQVIVSPPATLDQGTVVQELQQVYAILQAGLSDYFGWLQTENVDWLGISVAMFYDSIADPTVRVEYRPQEDSSSTVYTFDDADLQNFIRKAKQQGLKIYLTLAFEPSDVSTNVVSSTDPNCRTPLTKPNRSLLGLPDPTVDPLGACVNPADWWWNPAHPNYAANVAQFWKTYTDVAVKYAALAQQLGIDMYSLGTETDNLFRSRPAGGVYTNDFRTQLAQMVAAVRANYSGPLTYDQHINATLFPQWFGGGAGSAYLFSDIGFDVVGQSGYVGLTASNPGVVLSVAELESLWDPVFTNFLVPLQAANPGKPIVFTEMGYVDDVGATFNPASKVGNPIGLRNADGFTDGMLQQQNILQAFFNMDEKYNNVVRGAFLWGNEIFTPGSCNYIDFDIRCRAAEVTVKDTYALWAVLSPPLTVNNYQGLWWAAPGGSEAGWGINFAHQGDTIFASWFTYDLMGKGTWLVMTATKTAPNTYGGALLQGTGPAFNALPFPPLGSPGGATVSGLSGTGTLTFSDANDATFAYTLSGISQIKAITRELIGPQPTCLFGALADLRLATNYTDLWWAAPAGSEAGWGINLTHQGDTIFATWYTFDVDHTPMWLVVTATKSAPGVYAGTPVYRLTGPPFNTVPFPPLGSPGGATGIGVGSASFTFSDGNTATFTYTVNGVTQSKTIAREVFTAPGTVCQ